MSNSNKYRTAVKMHSQLTGLSPKKLALRVYRAVNPRWSGAVELNLRDYVNDFRPTPQQPRAELDCDWRYKELGQEEKAYSNLHTYHLRLRPGRMNPAIVRAICTVCELPFQTWELDYESGRFEAVVRATYEAAGRLADRPAWAGVLNDLEIAGRNVEISIVSLDPAQLPFGRPGQEPAITNVRPGQFFRIVIHATEFEGPVRFALFDVDTPTKFTLLAPSDYSTGRSDQANDIQVPPLRENVQGQPSSPVGFQIMNVIGIAHLLAVVCCDRADIALPEASPDGSFRTLSRQDVDRLSAALRKLNDPNLFGIGITRYQVLP